jgi:peptide/nickel transport system substrate-binding protein
MKTLARRFAHTLAVGVATVAISGAALAQQSSATTLVIGSSQVPRHFNGAVQSGLATAMPSTQIFASPLRYDDNWNPQPYLAQSWEVSKDGRAVTLKLVENAVFHDGKPVTSEDVAFSIDVIKKNHPFETMLAPVESVETPDKNTVVIRLSQPHPALLLAMSPALMPILPKHVYGDGQDIASHPANLKPVGSGPYRFVEYRQGEHIVLERFDDFFIEGRPHLDRIVIRIIPDPNSLVIAAQRKEIQMLPFLSGIRDIERLQKSDGITVTERGYEGIGPLNWLAFNTAKKPLDDVRVRQAIAYAVDRDFLVNRLLSGLAKPSTGPIVNSSPFYEPNVEKFDLDLDKANALLDEAGHPRGGDGNRFTLTVDYIPGLNVEQQRNFAEYLRPQLRKVGIAVEVRSAPDFPTWARRVSNYEFDMAMDVVFNWGDPVIGVHRTYLCSNIREGIIWTNTQQYCNERVDELLEAAGQETNPDKRKALYSEFQKLAVRDVPIHYVNVTPYHTAYDSNIANPPVSIWGPMSPLDEVQMKAR